MKKIVRLFFDIFAGVRVNGLENIKNLKGNVLFVSNHNSFIDGVLLWAYIPDNLCFTISPVAAKKWWIKPFLKLGDFFILDSANPMAVKTIIAEIKKGKKIVVYPEGRVSNTGYLMKIYPGPAMIADKADAKIVPLYIEGTQYSVFSYFSSRIKVSHNLKFSVNIFKPETPDVTDGVNGEERKNAFTKKIYDIMTDAKYQSSVFDETLLESVINTVKLVGRRTKIVEDNNTKELSYGELLKSVFMTGRQIFNNNDGDIKAGIMLPTSVELVNTFFAMHAFGIVPCMLNFSTGLKNMLSCCTAAEIKKVYTSKSFVEKNNLYTLVEGLQKKDIKVFYLEELLDKVSLTCKLNAVAASYFPWHYYKKIRRKISSKDPAVILFTSGSEGVPKGVVLSHENLQANKNQVFSVLQINVLDRFFVVLPLFHSFGLMMGVIMPVLSGIKTFYYHTPLHYRIIPELIYSTNSTFLFGTDTFFAGYARNANAYDFYSVKTIIIGGEKLKDSTARRYFDTFGVRMFEAYGATEASPIVSLNSNMYYKPGSIGRPLPGIEIKLKEIPGITMGKELCVRGRNIMLGYLKTDRPGVIQTDSLKNGWYETGDIVEIDGNDFIEIKGRAKRFAKIAGEMVSLTAVETEITAAWQSDQHAVVAVPDERKGEQLVLFTTNKDLTSLKISELFKSQGFSELFVPKKIKFIEEMLLMGNGKTDYVSLNKLARESF